MTDQHETARETDLVSSSGLDEAERRAVLAANDAFYRAFAAGDAAVMADLWSRSLLVACIHPGWAPLAGRQAVLDSWNAILAAPQPTQVSCRDAWASRVGPSAVDGPADRAMVICKEVLAGQGLLAATNLFVREDDAWRIFHHHAGPVAALSGMTHEQDDPVH